MPTIAEAIRPRDTSKMTLISTPAESGFPPIPTPDAQQFVRNSFLVSPHPLVATADSLRQFYQNHIPQQRVVLPVVGNGNG